jgi:hypothetical protein
MEPPHRKPVHSISDPVEKTRYGDALGVNALDPIS